MTIGEADEAALAAKFEVMRPLLDERQWRVYLGSEANALGTGGIAAVARASGASRNMVSAGAAEARDPGALAALEPGRSRRAGAGRPTAEDRFPGLTRALKDLLEEGKRGDPVSEITWSILSLRDIAAKLGTLGYPVSKDTVAGLMRAGGWSLRGMSRVLEGTRHPDRDAQFRHISGRIEDYRASGDPVLSIDGKKKEKLGACYREGVSWRPAGDPVRVCGHSLFGDRDGVTAVPYGIYDIAANRGFVSVGTSGDTAAFAVNALRLWWQQEGSLRCPRATRLLLTCDSGGSNDYRSWLWKEQLAILAAETGLRIEVAHFPSGTSKWNKIEHRLFCHITRTWRARPLMTLDDVTAGIAATVTARGLKCTAVRDDREYASGARAGEDRKKYLQDRLLDRDEFHGEWNYAVLPAPRLGPLPEPGHRRRERAGRVPAAVLNHPALTGMQAADLTALAARLQAPFEARLQLDYRLRSGPRRRENRSCGRHGTRLLDLTDHLLALRLRDHLNLPHQAIGALLGAEVSVIGRAITLARELLEAAGSTPEASPPPASIPRTPGELLARAADAGIPLTIPESRHTMPERFRTRTTKPSATRPKRPTK